MAFLLTLSIIAYCNNNTAKFDPTCTNGTASTEKVSVENTENCTVCTTKGYALTKVGDFEECREIPYVCTNGIASTEKVSVENTENCTACTTVGYVLTEVGDFMECRIPYICTNGKAIDGGAITATENCGSCRLGYSLTKVGDFNECPPGNDNDGDGTPDMTDVDVDGDGLIEIHTLNDLATIQYDLDGSGSDDDNSKMRTLGDTGCGGLNSIDSCTGYELMQNLDFRNSSSYATVNTDWLPDPSLLDNTSINFSSLAETSSEAGWIPIGSSGNTFSATFEGNGFTISNLYVRGSVRVGFFGETSSSAKIRNIGLVDGAVFGGGGNDSVGGLVGYNTGVIIASYATGNADGGGGGDSVGGLAGYNDDGSITASYATGNVNNGVGANRVGGLVGLNDGGSIIASYATGNVNNAGGGGSVGGLVGYNDDGSITASYATGNTAGGAGSIVKAFVGYSDGGGSITDSNSYSVMNAMGIMSGSFGATWNFVWDFGTDMQPPALRYADYDVMGTGNINYCGEIFPVNVVCGTTLLPGQGR